jgi:tetratricopeptide (TPR) repeat protein
MSTAGSKKPGRNDPCPCGSKRRYKECCGALARPALEQAAALDGTDLSTLMQQGNWRAVQMRARAQLEQEPESGWLWKILSVALAQGGEDALPALRRTAELLPDDAEALRNLGAVLLERNNLADAVPALQRALELAPEDQPLLVALANCLCALSRPREAVPLYERALRLDPQAIEAHNNLGNALQELGEFTRAIAAYRQALELKPADAEITTNLGNALRQFGQFDEALLCAQRALVLAPGLSLAHNNLGLVLFALGRRREAIASFRQALQRDGNFVQALHNLGRILCEGGEYAEALPVLLHAAALDPRSADSHFQVGTALNELGGTCESIASFEQAIALNPSHYAAHLGLAAALRIQGDSGRAETACRTVLAAQPDHVGALTVLGELHADRGDFVQAQELCGRALRLDPGCVAALSSFAAQRRMSPGDASWRQQVEAVLAKPLPRVHQIGLRYALGKYYDDLAYYPEAFGQYQQANELSKSCMPAYEPTQLVRHFEREIALGEQALEFAARPNAGASRRPVFLIGMLRSGTSLIEQILASHPQITGVGEVRFWDAAAQRYARSDAVNEAPGAALDRLGQEYHERLGALADTAVRTVDKMPGNFLYAGLIHAAMPGARIIHVQRNPLDTCISLYFQNFGALHTYAHDLGALAHYYRQYLRAMQHWRAKLPADALLEVHYEDLVKDQEYWTRRMLQFIELPWHPRCLDFHKTERSVITASRWQVRQRMHAGSVGRWRRYEQHLAALLPLLEDARDQSRA